MNNINNFLSAFEKEMTSLERYVCYDFFFDDLINDPEDYSQEALSLYREYKANPSDYFKTLMNWEKGLLDDPDDFWLEEIPANFDLRGLSPKEYLIELIIEELQEEPIEVNWSGEFSIEFLCSVCCYDIFFETTKSVYWLSFGIYD